MRRIVRNLAVTAALLAGLPVASLLLYDLVAIQPRLNQVEEILQTAPELDANPPLLIRKMIDANSGDPSIAATRNVVWRVYPESSNLQRLLRESLWRLLLPVHVGQDGMYGLYATLSFNGTDYGLSSYAGREFGVKLDQLTLAQAAATVAVTHFPSAYSRDADRLSQRAQVLLKKSRVAP